MRETRGGIGNRIAPARFLVFLALLAGGTIAWHVGFGGKWADALAAGFDASAALYLVSLIPLLHDADAETLRRHARENDANRLLVLVLALVIVLVVLAALAGELPEATRGNLGAAARLLGAIAFAWLFSMALYALHYTHLYYGEDPEKKGADRGGLDFPGKSDPLFSDFLYFSATLAMTFQTSDVAITSRRMRSIVLMQSLGAFVFNLGIIALVINALGGLASGGGGAGG